MIWKPSAIGIRARQNLMRDLLRDNQDLSSEDIERIMEDYDLDIGHPGAGRRWWRETTSETLCEELKRGLESVGHTVEEIREIKKS